MSQYLQFYFLEKPNHVVYNPCKNQSKGKAIYPNVNSVVSRSGVYGKFHLKKIV